MIFQNRPTMLRIARTLLDPIVNCLVNFLMRHKFDIDKLARQVAWRAAKLLYVVER